jgi:hypothetical protein
MPPCRCAEFPGVRGGRRSRTVVRDAIVTVPARQTAALSLLAVVAVPLTTDPVPIYRAGMIWPLAAEGPHCCRKNRLDQVKPRARRCSGQLSGSREWRNRRMRLLEMVDFADTHRPAVDRLPPPERGRLQIGMAEIKSESTADSRNTRTLCRSNARQIPAVQVWTRRRQRATPRPRQSLHSLQLAVEHHRCKSDRRWADR